MSLCLPNLHSPHMTKVMSMNEMSRSFLGLLALLSLPGLPGLMGEGMDQRISRCWVFRKNWRMRHQENQQLKASIMKPPIMY